MKCAIKKLFQTSLLLKITALLYAYFLWLILSQSCYTSLFFSAPITWYDIPQNVHLQTPSSVTIHIAGKRGNLRSFISQKPGIHIDAHSLKPGKHEYSLSEEEIFLPEEIKLLDYNPSLLNIEVTQK